MQVLALTLSCRCGQNLTVYGDGAAADTAGGADSISKSPVLPHRLFTAQQVVTP